MPVLTVPMRSLHPLFILGVSVVSASSTAAAVSNDIQMPHRLFREGMLRKSALSSEENHELGAIELPSNGVSNDAVLERDHAGDDVSVDGEVSRDGSEEAAHGWFEYNRQESGDELLLSLPNTEEAEVEIEVGTDITEDIDDGDDSEIDPDCVEVEGMVADPSINRRKNLLRRHLESKSLKASKEHTKETHPNMHHPHPNHLAKSDKAATSVNTLSNAQIPPPVSESKTANAATSTIIYKPKSGKASTSVDTLQNAQIPPLVSNTGDAATSPNVYQPTPEAKNGKTAKAGKAGKAGKGCKSGKSCNMVVKCTSPPSKAPSAATNTVTPVRTEICRYK